MNSNGLDVCDKNFRPRWMNRGVFLLAAVGSSIGLGNIWKFPYLTWKHGGTVFVLAYAIALIFVGIPMLILELTLGQKMQRGSAGAIRGILPRFAGAGWAAAFAAFITAVIYILLLSIVAIYLVTSGTKPWKAEHYEPTRPAACRTAAKAAMTSEELYLYMNVTGLYDPQSCEPFSLDGEQTPRYAQNLFHASQVIWFFMFLATARGPKSIGICSMFTATLPFVFLFACMGGFMALNANPTGMEAGAEDFIAGDGLSFYWGYKEFPLPPGPDGVPKSYKPSSELGSLMQDAYGQVFFSVGVCVGVMFAYGSYNPIKQTVIANAFFIGIIDFIFSILAGFVVWSAIGYLEKVEDPNYSQTNSVGLTFIAFPTLAARLDGDENNDMGAMFTLFMILLFVSGIDSAVSYVESWITNVLDAQYQNSMVLNTKTNQNNQWIRVGTAAWTCLGMGQGLSALFCSSFGWVLFDLVDHYISSYLIIGIGLMQCVAVGWLFEYNSTAACSPEHARALRYLGLWFWIPIVTISFYTNAAFPDYKWVGIILMIVFAIISWVLSFCMSKSRMSFTSWYHEIFFCGVDKLSMSITSLSNGDGSRSFWMPLFELYFGLCIKFLNPAALTFLFMQNLIDDLESPYAEQPAIMHVLASILVMIGILAVFVPMFTCDYPEKFEFDPNLEFAADQIYSDSLKSKNKVQATDHSQTGNQSEIELNTSKVPLNKPNIDS